MNLTGFDLEVQPFQYLFALDGDMQIFDIQKMRHVVPLINGPDPLAGSSDPIGAIPKEGISRFNPRCLQG
ncbi:hypothetical protein JCM17846_03990 [Iodidimonas nitroreducens]|uniref:Uncharacterized protein n=1 Tax=Iodidimonas nitroreducens TaxID=1236968 RepID=A0A5A7N3X9_9PROT|nr:hypothetical protein JCM17846_03990 [Iodidimonas nitroreducens]